VLTVDLQVIGQRHQDIKNGMTVPPEWSLSKLLDFASKPSWVAGVLRGKRRSFGNIVGHVKGTEDLTKLSEWTASQFDTSLNWKDIDWIRSIWPGKLILKGILDVEDAELAAKTGAQAIVVSNHGGRQLDGAPSSIEVLPEIVDTVGSQMEIMFDGGIRTGMDVVRALALGAKSCMIGRAYAYGLGAGGEGRRRQGARHPRQGNAHHRWDCAASTRLPRSTIICWRCEAADQTLSSSRRTPGPIRRGRAVRRCGRGLPSTTPIGGYGSPRQVRNCAQGGDDPLREFANSL
jgi:L-lactate dehydrogenase (cytochrome)